jgi:hypothetical protein
LSEIGSLVGWVLIGLSLVYLLTAVMVGAHFFHLGPVALGIALAVCSVPIAAHIWIPFLWTIPSGVGCLLVVLFIAEIRVPVS